MKIESINLLSSASCDLKCKYCYIPKTKSLGKIQKNLLNKIKNENFLDPVINLCDNLQDIKYMGFWGLEPTKTFEEISNRFDYIFNTFPNLENFAFSTNLQGNNNKIIDFIKKLGNTKKINIGIQVSIDGMPEINNLTRGKNSGEKIISNLRSLLIDLISLLNNQNNISIALSDKCTLSSTILEFYNKDENSFLKNFRFMNELYEELYSFSKPEYNLNIHFGGMNFEQPYDYSKDHGIMFSNMLKNLDELKNKENLKYIQLPLIERIKRIVNYGDEFNNKNLMFTCGASKGFLSIGLNDNILDFCHRDFFLTEDKFTKNFKNEYYSLHSNCDNVSRQRYLSSCYTNFPKIKLLQIITMCKELSYCDLIDKSYNNYDKSYLLAMFLAAENCPSQALSDYCSPYITNMGYIKLMANGAFDFLLEKVIKS